MARFRNILLPILLICGLQQVIAEGTENVTTTTPPPLSDGLEKLAKLGLIVISSHDIPYATEALKIWTTFNKLADSYNGVEREDFMDDGRKLDLLRQEIKDLAKNVRDFKSSLFKKLDSDNLLSKLEDKVNHFKKAFDVVRGEYRNFLLSIQSNLFHHTEATRTFALKITTNDPVETSLTKIHEILYGDEEGSEDSIYYQLKYIVPEKLTMCLMRQSIQHTMFYFYERVVEAEVKGYIMMLHAHDVLQKMQPNTTLSVGKVHEDNFINRMEKLTSTLKTLLKDVPRELWKCEAKRNKLGVDYTRFGPFFQKIVVNKKNLASRESEESQFCEHSCPNDAIDHSNSYDSCEPGHDGRLRSCSDEILSFNVLTCPYKAAEDRYERYQYIKTGPRVPFTESFVNRELYNRTADGCYKSSETPRGEIRLSPMVYQQNADPYHDPQMLPYIFPWTNIDRNRTVDAPCLSCLCTCDDSRNAFHRYISVKPVLADEHNVITGVKIEYVGRAFFIRIMQGKLLPKGKIEPGSSRDKGANVNSPDYKDPRTLNPEDLDKHYFKPSFDRKKFYLEDIHAPSKDHVITGIKFAREGNDGLKLDVRFTKFSFNSTNSSKPVENVWSSEMPKNSSLKWEPVDLEKNRELPTSADVENNEVAKQNHQTVELINSDLKDSFGGIILPYIDIQPVKTEPPAPLSGAGLFRRATPGSAGYLALKLFTYDYAQEFVNSTWLNKHQL